ncbi:MAG TPA: hypothetical protein VFE31_01035 [Opitutaceae bacterium]|nr:hypothetical protein [Opitutaceae bacterium]
MTLLAGLLAAASTANGAQNNVWVRGAFPGFEVYSDAPIADIEGNLRDLQLLNAFVRALWPQIAEDEARPVSLLIVPSKQEYADLIGERTLPPRAAGFRTLLGNHPMALIKTWSGEWTMFDRALGVHLSQSPWLNFVTQSFLACCLMRRVGERPPSWLYAGMFKLISGALCSDGDIELPPVTRGAPARFVPLKALLGDDHPQIQQFSYDCNTRVIFLFSGLRPDRRGTEVRTVLMDGTIRPFWATLPFGPFADESYDFVTFGLLGERGRYRRQFIRFAESAASGPVDEANFQQVFGMSYDQMLQLLRTHTEAVKAQIFRWAAPDSLPARLRFLPANPRQVDARLREWRQRFADPVQRAEGEAFLLK